MEASRLAEALDGLVRKYREVPFSSWEAIFPDVGRLVDQASANPADDDWWQAQTDVLEIASRPDGRKCAQVVIVLYPQGMDTGPEPPSASLSIYDDGRVEGAWANGVAFEFLQLRSGAV